MAERDMINHPPHYTHGDIECIDAIAAALGPEGFQAYCRGTIIKYSWRVEHKGAGSQDLGKIGWYADRALAARKTTSPQPMGIQVEMSPYEVAVFALGDLQSVRRMVTVEGKKLDTHGLAKLFQAKDVLEGLLRDPKVVEPAPVTQENPQAMGVNQQIHERIGRIRKVANLNPALTQAGVLREVEDILMRRIVGSAIIGDGGYPKNPEIAIMRVAEELRPAFQRMLGTTITKGSPLADAVTDILNTAQALYMQVKPCP